jgi:hypothetical protein
MNIATKSASRSLRLMTLPALGLLLLGTTVAFISCSGDKKEETKATPQQIQGSLIRQLVMMADQIQQARQTLDSVVTDKGWRSPEGQQANRNVETIDSVNVVQLEQIIAQNGWPGKSKVGDQAAMAAFLILQHAKVEIQTKYLPMVEAAAAKGDVEPSHLAMLQDRVLMRQGKQQKYGTQLWNDPSTGKLGLYPIEDSANVDARRAEVGIPPLRDYIRSLGIDPDSLSQPTKPEITIQPAGSEPAK